MRCGAQRTRPEWLPRRGEVNRASYIEFREYISTECIRGGKCLRNRLADALAHAYTDALCMRVPTHLFEHVLASLMRLPVHMPW
jgi:hypothetical protein